MINKYAQNYVNHVYIYSPIGLGALDCSCRQTVRLKHKRTKGILVNGLNLNWSKILAPREYIAIGV